MAESKPTITPGQIIGIIFAFALSAMWLITWTWIQDQSNRLRAEENINTRQVSTLTVLEQNNIELQSRVKVLEQNNTAMEATRKALEPYSADDRLLLKNVALQVNRQDDKLQYVVNTIEKINEIVQILGKDQVATNRRLEAAEALSAKNNQGKK